MSRQRPRDFMPGSDNYWQYWGSRWADSMVPKKQRRARGRNIGHMEWGASQPYSYAGTQRTWSKGLGAK